MVIADLHNYTITNNVSPQISYRGYNISSYGLPSGGDVVLSIMKPLEGYGDIGHAAAVNISIFRMNEAIRFAYGEVSTHLPTRCIRAKFRGSGRSLETRTKTAA